MVYLLLLHLVTTLVMSIWARVEAAPVYREQASFNQM